VNILYILQIVKQISLPIYEQELKIIDIY